MITKRLKFIQISFMIMDLLVTLFAFRVALLIRNIVKNDYLQFSDAYWLFMGGILIILPLLIYTLDVYKYQDRKRKRDKFELVNILPKLFMATMFTYLLAMSSLYLLKNDIISRLFIGILFVVHSFGLLVSNFVFKMSLRRMLRRTSFYRRIIIAGYPEKVKDLVDYLKCNNELFVEIVGVVHLNGYADYTERSLLGSFEDLPEIVKKQSIDDVVITVPHDNLKHIEPYIYQCETMGITVHLVMDVYDMKIAKTDVSSIGTIPTITWYTVTLDPWQNLIKRLVDILGGFIGLLITLILSIFIVPAIKFESKGPALFRQKRIGKNGRQFHIYKFRSMCNDAEVLKKKLMEQNEMSDYMFKIKEDPRITKVGRFIRDTSLDELPQFWNVLIGEMSLVGTRPPTLDEVDKYDLHHWRRLSVKPGITGMWQVSGRNQVTDFEDVVKLDVKYIDNWSIWADFSIIFKTIHAVIKRSGR